MREIKFRYWNKTINEMLVPGFIANNTKWNVDMGYILMQYTGLKDKNGKEIYEGDIVKCLEVSTNITREYVSEVFFEDGCYLVHESKMCDVELYLYDNSNPTKIPLTEIEVIGNIYENPELLEVE